MLKLSGVSASAASAALVAELQQLVPQEQELHELIPDGERRTYLEGDIIIRFDLACGVCASGS